MGHTYASNLVHCIFSTKVRAPVIPPDQQEKLWAYLVGIAKNHVLRTLAVGGIANHVHVLLALPPSKACSAAGDKVRRDAAGVCR
ncbi:MAG: transposase [Terriglobales bacterium]